MGHFGKVGCWSLSRSEQVKALLAGPSPISPMKAEITILPISNRKYRVFSGFEKGFPKRRQGWEAIRCKIRFGSDSTSRVSAVVNATERKSSHVLEGFT